MVIFSKTNQGISYWAADDEVNSKMKIKEEIQIYIYNQVLGLPLKAVLEIIGSNNLGNNTVEKNWKFGELKASSGLIIIKIKIEMGINKIFIYKDLFEIFPWGWETAWNKVTVTPSFSKSNTKSSGKALPRNAESEYLSKSSWSNFTTILRMKRSILSTTLVSKIFFSVFPLLFLMRSCSVDGVGWGGY